MNLSSRQQMLAAGIALAMSVTPVVHAAENAAPEIVNARQEAQIWTTYALNPNLRANDLGVSVLAGKATLTGKVAEGVSKDLAEQIALGVNGIKTVDNEIVVQSDYMPNMAASVSRSYGEMIDDATITSTIKSKLLWSRYTSGLAIKVDTTRGQVVLTGSADSPTAKDLAGRLAMNTRGVTAVNNQLTVRTVGPTTPAPRLTSKEAAEDISDSWITTKVKSTLLYSRNIDSNDITVSTSKGIVMLSGKVDNGAERELAIELAKNIKGVRSVQSKGLRI